MGDMTARPMVCSIHLPGYSTRCRHCDAASASTLRLSEKCATAAAARISTFNVPTLLHLLHPSPDGKQNCKIIVK